MGTPIKIKDLGTDEATGLLKKLYVWRIITDAKAETISVEYNIVLLSGNGSVATVVTSGNYLRYNKPAVFYTVGESMTAGTLAIGGEIIPGSDPEDYYEANEAVAEGTIALGFEIKVSEDLKYDELVDDYLNDTVLTRIEDEIESYPNLEQ